MRITPEVFGETSAGETVTRYTLDPESGFFAQVLNYGGIITQLHTPDRDGNLGDIILGYDTFAKYEADRTYQGAAVGRFANRIAEGQFTLAGQVYQLTKNSPPHHLHGGTHGYNKVIWQVEEFRTTNCVGLILTYHSPDGEEGYPGAVDITMRYTFTRDHEFRIEYTAVSDQATPFNMTNHCYWNLGAATGDTLAHELTLHANAYLPVTETLIPTGKQDAVRDTPFDFTSPHPIGERLADLPDGYDHCYVLPPANGAIRPAATLYDPGSGRVMEINTTAPGLQFFSCAGLPTSLRGKGNAPFGSYRAVCLETQDFPDAPHQPGFPSCVLYPNRTYQHVTSHKFSCR